MLTQVRFQNTKKARNGNSRYLLARIEDMSVEESDAILNRLYEIGERREFILEHVPAERVHLTTDCGMFSLPRPLGTGMPDPTGFRPAGFESRGTEITGTVETTAEADWDELMAVNPKGVYLCSRFAIPSLAAPSSRRYIRGMRCSPARSSHWRRTSRCPWPMAAPSPSSDPTHC